jgi:hypothetical protein
MVFIFHIIGRPVLRRHAEILKMAQDMDSKEEALLFAVAG